MIKKYMILLLMLLPFGAAAQEATPAPRWTLAQCIEWARENNIQILQQELAIRDAELSAQQARLDYIPSVNAGVGSNTSFGNSYDPVSQNSQKSYTSVSGSASVTTTLFGGFKKHHNLRRADLSLKETLMSVEKARNDLTLNVTAAYLEVLFAEERLRISESQTELLEMQVDKTRKQAEAGAATVGDLLQIQSQLADARQQKLVSENRRVLAYFNLCQMLEIEDFMNFRIVEPESVALRGDTPVAGTEEIMDAAQSLPQIEGAKLGIEIAKKNISMAKSDLYPTLNLSVGYGSNYSSNMLMPDPNNVGSYLNERYPFLDQVKNHAGASASLSLSIPIFNSMKARNNVKSSNMALRRAEYGLMLAQKQLGAEIQQAFIDVHAALERYNSSVANADTYEESFRMVEQKFNLGAATPVEYGTALFNLMDARSALLQAKYEYVFKTRILDFYKGIPIDL